MINYEIINPKNKKLNYKEEDNPYFKRMNCAFGPLFQENRKIITLVPHNRLILFQKTMEHFKIQITELSEQN